MLEKQNSEDAESNNVNKLSGLSGVDTHFSVAIASLTERLALYYSHQLPNVSAEEIAQAMIDGLRVAIDKDRIATYLKEQGKTHTP